VRTPGDMTRRGLPSSRIALLLVGAILFMLLVSVRGIAGFFTDYLWFDEIGQTVVWRGVLGTKIGLGVAFTLAFFALLWVNLAVADRMAPRIRPAGPEEQFVERYHELIGARARVVRIAVSGLFALLAGPGVAAQWHSWVLFRNQVAFGVSEPQFGRDVGFYVFRLPFLTFLLDWLFVTMVIVVAVTAVAHYLNGGIRLQTPLQKVTPQVKAHLSVLLAVLAVLKAASYYLERFELLLSDRAFVQGAGYTDVNARLPALNLLVVISLFACVLLLFNIARRGWVLPAIAVGLWAMLSAVVGAAIPAAVQKFRVEPTESTKEAPFIKRNIEATQVAFDLDVQQVGFAASDTLTQTDLIENEETIRNVRLWDPEIVTETFKRLQEVRSFYQFNDVDVDRYEVDGQPTQVLVSARELNRSGVPSKSWVNQQLVYTHGYGAIATPSSGVTQEGNPAFRLRDLPPQGRPALSKQPAVYFGQGLEGYAIVNTKQEEIDYTEASGEDHTTSYAGTGGVEMSSLLRRGALALRFGDLNPFISTLITPESRAIYIRDIDERVRRAAPFLRYDADPYPVIVDGAIKWIYDAYTVSDRFPYSEQAETDRLPTASGLRIGRFNYVRNSVKVVIDAYSGAMTFYTVDENDPVIKSYRKAFPGLFTPGDEVPRQIAEHFRYPEDLFRVQTNMYGRYHVEDPAAFYKGTDAWDIAQEPGVPSEPGTTQTLAPTVPGQPEVRAREQRMDPYYLLMRLPDEEEASFVILQPFVPYSDRDSRKDLTAFIVAKPDGSMRAFITPRSGQVDGPALVSARINQNPEVSEARTLLGREGSKVRFGNLLALPVQESLLWVQPFYVEATSTPLPQLKRVVVVFGSRVVVRPTLKEALTAIFGNSPPTLEELVPGQAGEGTPSPPPTTPGEPETPAPTAETAADLIAQAEVRFASAEEALRRGDLAGYQRETGEARNLIRRANELLRPPEPTTTTTVMRATA